MYDVACVSASKHMCVCVWKSVIMLSDHNHFYRGFVGEGFRLLCMRACVLLCSRAFVRFNVRVLVRAGGSVCERSWLCLCGVLVF